MVIACLSAITSRVLNWFTPDYQTRADTLKELKIKLRASGLVDSLHLHKSEFLLPNFVKKQRVGVCIVDSNKLRLITTIPTPLRKLMTVPDVDSSRGSIDIAPTDVPVQPSQSLILDTVIDQLLAKALLGKTIIARLRTLDGMFFNTVCYPCNNAAGVVVGAVFFIQGPMPSASPPRPSLDRGSNDAVVRRIETLRRGIVNTPGEMFVSLTP